MKSPLWFAVPAVFVLSAVFIAPVSLLASAAFAGLFVVSAIYVSSVGYYTVKGEFIEYLSWLTKNIQGLSSEQQAAVFLKFPELHVFFGGNPDQPATIMFEKVDGVDLAFFIEFMNKSRGGVTWAEGAVEGTPYEGRDIRREKWRKVGEWLLINGYVEKFSGNHTYRWVDQSYHKLMVRYVDPYARFVGMVPVRIPGAPVPQEKTNLYQAEA